MPLSRTAARDEILALVKSVADDLVDATSGKPLCVVYDDVAGEVPKDNPPVPWARATVQHQTGNQASLAGVTGTRRYTRTGLLTVQVFTPTGDGLETADDYSQAFLDAFQGRDTTNGVWFLNATANEVGVDGPWFQVNVIVTFQYDEIA